MAGSPCPTEVMKRVVSDMHLSQITIAYGMTETSPVSCQSSVDTPLEKRVSTVGLVQPHLEVKVIDPESGAIALPGVSGELCTRGYSVMHWLLGRSGPHWRSHRRRRLDAHRRTLPPWTPKGMSTSSAASRTW